MKNFIETAIEKFSKENPYADSFELAQYFYNLGRKDAKEQETAQRDLERKMPKFYGD